MTLFRRGPPNGVVECKGYEKKPISRFISKMKQDRAIGTMERQYELVCGLSNLIF